MVVLLLLLGLLLLLRLLRLLARHRGLRRGRRQHDVVTGAAPVGGVLVGHRRLRARAVVLHARVLAPVKPVAAPVVG